MSAYDYAMEITEQKEADRYLAELVDKCMKERRSRGEPATPEMCMEIQRGNLGYWAGYYDSETRARVERLFRCAHPIFGPIADNGVPTPEQAFQAGVEMGRKIKHESKL